MLFMEVKHECCMNVINGGRYSFLTFHLVVNIST